MPNIQQVPPVRRINERLPRHATSPRRWRLEPLLDLAIIRYQPIVERNGDRLMYSHEAVKQALGISGTTAQRIDERGLTDEQADRFAIMLGYHPSEVWGPEWFYSAMTPDDWYEVNEEMQAIACIDEEQAMAS